MEPMSTYTVTARRWKHGWELHIDGVGVTQSRTLTKAEQQARDYIATVLGEEDADIVISPDLGDKLSSTMADVLEARTANDEAARAQKEAAEKNRRVVREMRDADLSVSDISAVMHVSKQRVSQLLNS